MDLGLSKPSSVKDDTFLGERLFLKESWRTAFNPRKQQGIPEEQKRKGRIGKTTQTHGVIFGKVLNRARSQT